MILPDEIHNAICNAMGNGIKNCGISESLLTDTALKDLKELGYRVTVDKGWVVISW